MTKFKIAQKTILEWDLRGCLYLNHLSHQPNIAQFFKVISRLGDWSFWVISLGIVWLIKGWGFSIQMLYLVAASSMGTLLYKLLKRHTVRPRPYQVHQVIRLGERPLDHFSFPSGHTLHAVLMTTVLGSLVPPLLFILLPFTVLVALSRMVLGLHYPTDVLVGAALGAILGGSALWLAPVFSIHLWV